MNNSPFFTPELYPEDSPAWRLIQARWQRATANRARHTQPHSVNNRPAADFYEDLINRASQALVSHVSLRLERWHLSVFQDPTGCRRVRVMGALDYVIDDAARKVWAEPSPIDHDEEHHRAGPPWGYMSRRPVENVDLLNPLCKPAWLEYVAARPGWFASPFAKHQPRQQQLFLEPLVWVDILQQVVRTAFMRLRHLPSLAQLRSELAATLAAQLGHDLLELGLRSRPWSRNICLSAEHLNQVWQHRCAFETMARENPQLLSALAAWLDDDGTYTTDNPSDALPAMRTDLLADGLPPKAWRVLSQQGLHKLLPSQARHSLWSTMTQTLWSLHHAQWPPVPPRAFIQLLNDVAGRPQAFRNTQGKLGGWFWRVACTEADRLRQQASAFETLASQIPQHTYMLRETGGQPDANQLRAGMAWLQARTRQHLLFAQTRPEALWLDWLPDPAAPKHPGSVAWVVLRSSRDLLEESIALHNCAADYQGCCSNGTWAMISLRNTSTGKRLALVGLEQRAGQWCLAQVAGPCNRQVSTALRQQAHLALKWVRYHHPRPPTSPPPSTSHALDSAPDLVSLAPPQNP